MRTIASYHIMKTGGSTILDYFSRNGAVVFNYGQTDCFLALQHHSDLFPAFGFAASGLRHCKNITATNDSTVFVEFHSWSVARFWSELWPRRGAMAERHAASGGFFATLVLIRDPISHIASSYAMWPPMTNDTLVPLATWLTGTAAAGRQTRELTREVYTFLGCSTNTTELAIARLRAFTVACNMRWISRCLGLLVAEITTLNLSLDNHGHAQLPWYKPRSYSTPQAKVEVAKARATVPLAHWSRAAACDQRLIDREAEWMLPEWPTSLSILLRRAASADDSRGRAIVELACNDTLPKAQCTHVKTTGQCLKPRYEKPCSCTCIDVRQQHMRTRATVEAAGMFASYRAPDAIGPALKAEGADAIQEAVH